MVQFERHAHAGAAVQQGTYGQGEVFDFVSLAQRFAFGGQAGDADEFGFRKRQERKSCH